MPIRYKTTCPYENCGAPVSVDCQDTDVINRVLISEWLKGKFSSISSIEINMIVCNHCEEIAIEASVYTDSAQRSILGGGHYDEHKVVIYPNPKMIPPLPRNFEGEVPDNILNAYRESHLILHLSPNASSTMSRRALQGIIRDQWPDLIKGKSNLYEEIDALENNIDGNFYNAMHAVRSMGNIGAHMKSDVSLIMDIEKDEAIAINELVGNLIQAIYVDKVKMKNNLNEVVKMAKSKGVR